MKLSKNMKAVEAMSYEEKIKIYQSMIRNLEKELKHFEGTPYFEDEEFKIRERINMYKEEIRLYAQATKADEYEANLNEVKKQLKIKIRHARRDGDYSEAYAFSEALDMIGNLI